MKIALYIYVYWSLFGLIWALVLWEDGEFDKWTPKQQFLMQLIWGPVVWLWLAFWNLIVKPVGVIIELILIPFNWVWDKLGDVR